MITFIMCSILDIAVKKVNSFLVIVVLILDNSSARDLILFEAYYCINEFILHGYQYLTLAKKDLARGKKVD